MIARHDVSFFKSGMFLKKKPAVTTCFLGLSRSLLIFLSFTTCWFALTYERMKWEPRSTLSEMQMKQEVIGNVTTKVLSVQTHSTSIPHKYHNFLRRINLLVVGNSIWMAVTNKGDIESGMTENCWHHLRELNISNYIFVAVDEWSFKYLECNGINSYWDHNIWAENFSSGSLSFSDNPETPYQKLMSARLNLIDAILKAGINIFFSDTDVVWLRNVFDDFETIQKQYDMVFLHDGKMPLKGFPTNHVDLLRYKDKNPKWKRVKIEVEPDIQSNAGSFFMVSN